MADDRMESARSKMWSGAVVMVRAWSPARAPLLRAPALSIVQRSRRTRGATAPQQLADAEGEVVGTGQEGRLVNGVADQHAAEPEEREVEATCGRRLLGW